MRNAIIPALAAVSLALLATTAQAQTASPTTEEVQRYITSHPDTFAERKIFTVDQVSFRNSLPPEVIQQLKPMKTMDQLTALLTAHNIEFKRGSNKLDAVGSDPRVIDQVLKLGPDDLFAVPIGEMLVINKVTGIEVVPFTGDAATKYANELLSRKPETAGSAAK